VFWFNLFSSFKDFWIFSFSSVSRSFLILPYRMYSSPIFIWARATCSLSCCLLCSRPRLNNTSTTSTYLAPIRYLHHLYGCAMLHFFDTRRKKRRLLWIPTYFWNFDVELCLFCQTQNSGNSSPRNHPCDTSMTSLLVKGGNPVVSRLGGLQHRAILPLCTAAAATPRPRPRTFSSSPSSDNSSVAATKRPPPPPPLHDDDNAAYKQGMDRLKRTNPTLHRMAPTRGGTDLPDAKFMTVFAVVASAGFYSWFIHDPQVR
jgi:hypothetical protein